jgi:hypothetical protein
MKKKDVLVVFGLIDELLKDCKITALNWKLIQNKNLIKPLKEELDQFIEYSQEYKEFDQKRIDLCIKHSIKDEAGNTLYTFALDYSAQPGYCVLTLDTPTNGYFTWKVA